MAESKKIQGTDLIAEGYLKDAITEAEKFLSVITQTKNAIVDTNKATAGKLTNSKGSASKDLKEQNALMAESLKQRKLADAATQVELKAELNLQKAKKAAADFDKKKLMDDEKAIQIIQKQNSAYATTSKHLNELRNQYKDLAISGKSADKASQDLLKTIQQLDKELKDADASVGQFNRSVGDYKNSVKEALSESDAFKEGLGKLDSQTAANIAGFGGIINQLKKLKEAQTAATTGSAKLGNALKIGVIGTILLIAGAVASFFTASREGALEFDLLFNKIKAVLDVLIGSFIQLGKSVVLFVEATALALSGDFSAASDKVSESLNAIKLAFDINITAIINQVKAYDKLTIAIFGYEDRLRILQVQLAKSKMDEEDFNEIQQDTTISIDEQKKALDGAAAAREKQAQINKQIANAELSIAKIQLEVELRKSKVTEADIALAKKQGLVTLTQSNLSIKVSNEALNAINEKYLAELEAADKLDDLNRQEGESNRKLIQDQVQAEVELIRSKKLGADAQVLILTAQVNDEKFQLEERQKFEDQLRTKQLEAQELEVKQLAKFVSAKYEIQKDGSIKTIEFSVSEEKINELIAEKDAVRLQEKIKATNLSVIQQEEIAKVVVEAQKNEIAYNDQKKKFDEEQIKRSQTILQLQRETAIINENSKLDDITTLEQQRQKTIEASNAKILENDNVFNAKLIKQRNDEYLKEQDLLRVKNETQLDLLDKQHAIDQDSIKNSVNDEKTKIASLEKVDAAYEASKKKLTIEQQKAIGDLNNQQIAQVKAEENKKTEVILASLAQATQAYASELERRQNIQNQNADIQISRTQDQISKQQDLAERGLANSLAYQQEQLDKQRLAQQDAAKRQAKQQQELQLVQALFQAYDSELRNNPDESPTEAAGKAFADVLLLKGLAAGLVQFAAEGNDDVSGPGTTTSDSIPFMLSKHEGVVKADANMGNPGVVSALNAGTFDQLYMPKFDKIENKTSDNIANSILIQTNKEVISLLTEIKNKPVQHVNVDSLGNLLETVYNNGIKTVTKHKNKRSRI